MNSKQHRYAEDIEGMPCFAAIETLKVVLRREHMQGAVPQSDTHCAIALGLKNQFGTPYVSVGRYRTLIAEPHSEGVVVPGFGATKWAVLRYHNSAQARAIIVEADTDPDFQKRDEGAVVLLLATHVTDRPANKRARNQIDQAVKGVGAAKKREADDLTKMGVRILTGQRKRK